MVRVVAIVALAVVLLAAVIGITLAALLTDRDLWRAEAATLAGSLVLAAVSGYTYRRRRRRWRIERENGAGP